METELKQLREALAYQENLCPGISRENVQWHIYHCLMVIVKIEEELKKSNPEKFIDDKNSMRKRILNDGRINRYQGKSPDSVLPPSLITEEDMMSVFKAAEKSLKNIRKLNNYAYIKHPSFGIMCREDASDFIVIHTRHHLSIIRDIIKGNPAYEHQ